jgi:hypothetical protein
LKCTLNVYKAWFWGSHTENEFPFSSINALGTCLNMSYLVLYKFFCVCNHAQKKSQTIACSFLSTRQKIIPKKFIKWFKLTAEINPVLKWFRQVELNIPCNGRRGLYVLPSVRKVVENHYKSSKLICHSKLWTCSQCGATKCFQWCGSFFYKHS